LFGFNLGISDLCGQEWTNARFFRFQRLVFLDKPASTLNLRPEVDMFVFVLGASRGYSAKVFYVTYGFSCVFIDNPKCS
jgi:hypothetical protein